MRHGPGSRSFVCLSRIESKLIQSCDDDDVDEKRGDDGDDDEKNDDEKNDDDVLCATTGEPKNTARIRGATKRNVFKGDDGEEEDQRLDAGNVDVEYYEDKGVVER